jgi:acyl-CoA synthetase (AMP-forming)/AMP-acid ligase II
MAPPRCPWPSCAPAISALPLDIAAGTNERAPLKPRALVAAVAAAAAAAAVMGRISKHSGAKVVVLEDQHCLQKYQQIADEVKDIQTIVIWNPTGVEDGCVLPGGQRVVSWDKFLVEGENSSENLDARISMIKPGHCCALIYTSGTTGSAHMHATPPPRARAMCVPSSRLAQLSSRRGGTVALSVH